MATPFVVAYRTFIGPEPRPYLVLNLTGPNGRSGAVWGLLDSGADLTALPVGYASLMGYTTADLKIEQGSQAGGPMQYQRALKPAHGIVPEIPSTVVEFYPLFIVGAQNPLWGRGDFMARFDVTIMETKQRFAITPHD